MHKIGLLCCFCFLAACTQKQDARQGPVKVPVAVAAKPAVMQPFRYHKLIESSPGQYFDILSWGRGRDSSGAYMILHSDSTGKKYSTTTGDLEGSIIDVFNTDMNMDGHPEILIEAKAKDTTNHINIYAYEFKGTNSQKLNFPKLSEKTKKLYRGDDHIYIKEGNLIREFPVYQGSGKDAKPTGAKKILQYGFRDNTFSVKDISTDTAKVSDQKMPLSKPTRAQTSEKHTAHHSAEKKKTHHKEKKHKTKKPSKHTKKRHHRR
jgi:hypothetical protein